MLNNVRVNRKRHGCVQDSSHFPFGSGKAYTSTAPSRALCRGPEKTGTGALLAEPSVAARGFSLWNLNVEDLFPRMTRWK